MACVFLGKKTENFRSSRLRTLPLKTIPPEIFCKRGFIIFRHVKWRVFLGKKKLKNFRTSLLKISIFTLPHLEKLEK